MTRLNTYVKYSRTISSLFVLFFASAIVVKGALTDPGTCPVGSPLVFGSSESNGETHLVTWAKSSGVYAFGGHSTQNLFNKCAGATCED